MVKSKSNAIKDKKARTTPHTTRQRLTKETITITKSYGGRGCKQATVEQACAALMKTRGNISAAARLLGLTRMAFDHEYVQKIPEVMQAKDQARQIILDVTEDILEKQIRKAQPWAVCFTLKTIGKNRGYIEHPAAGMIDAADPDEFDMDRLTPEERETLSGLLEKALIK